MSQGKKTERNVVLVDGEDNRVGLMEIYKAHQGEGVRHRAISVVLHDGKKRVLLQKRSEKKPLWPLFWSNTVCTHPYEGESSLECAVRRLGEELGIDLAKRKEQSAKGNVLEEVYKLDYQARYNDELSENEITTVLVGEYGGGVELNSDEVAESRWVEWSELKGEVETFPERFTPWFRLIVKNGEVEKLINTE